MGTTKMKGRMVSVTFEVVGVKTVGQTQCFEVKITFPPEATGFQRKYRAYYCQATGRLERLQDVSVRPDGSTKHMTTDYTSQTQGPTFVTDGSGLVPFDWPDLAQQDVTTDSGQKAATTQSTSPLSVRSADGSVHDEDEVTMMRSSGTRESKLVQQWRDGEPWWRVAKRYENGQLVGEAVLLSVNGQPVDRRSQLARVLVSF